MLRAIAASAGFSLGRAFVYARPDLAFEPRAAEDPEAEALRYDRAVTEASRELAAVTERARGELGEDLAHIFRSQRTMVEDESTREEVLAVLREKRVCAELALAEVFDSYRTLFSELEDGDYNKARLADIDDVHKRILRCLLGRPEPSLSALPPGTIVVAEELLPSDTALLDPSRVAGILTEKGGVTSHAAILAKNLGIPAAVGLEGATRSVSTGDLVALDATDPPEARIHVNPDPLQMEALETRKSEYAAWRRRVESVRGLPPVTPDGRGVTVSANIGSVAEAAAAREKGATSVGLFRSEFLFLGKPALPGEEEQFLAYKAAAEKFPEGFVIIRTLDAGGDKDVSALGIGREDNPFLGYRALRVCLDRPDVFRPQIRAILRASRYGKVKLMFPMVSGLPELRAALGVLEECREELRSRSVPFDGSMEVGAMIEIPSAVFLARELAGLVDFFSVGTNDLTQYLLAADRMNGRLRSYYRSLDPSVFRAIKTVVDAAHEKGRWVGVCGELGGDRRAIPVLLGLGVDELSMSPQLVWDAVYAIRGIRERDARSLAERVLSLDSQGEIETLLNLNTKTEER